jgi:hypothetical protein
MLVSVVSCQLVSYSEVQHPSLCESVSNPNDGRSYILAPEMIRTEQGLMKDSSMHTELLVLV